MVIVFNIRNERDMLRVKGQLSNLTKTFPKISSELMLKLGKTLEKDLKSTARAAGIKRFTGNLFDKGIRYEQSQDGKNGDLLISDYGIALDRMSKHIVSVNSSRPILLRWALQSNNGQISSNAEKVASGKWKSFPLRVRPHPFIRAGFRRAKKKFDAITNQELRTKLKNVKN